MQSVTVLNRSLNFARHRQTVSKTARVMGKKFISYFSITIQLKGGVPRGRSTCSATEVE